jgi:hypothetical protein
VSVANQRPALAASALLAAAAAAAAQSTDETATEDRWVCCGSRPPAVALAEQTRIYSLWAEEKDIPPMEFPSASGQRVDMMYPSTTRSGESSRRSWFEMIE